MIAMMSDRREQVSSATDDEADIDPGTEGISRPESRVGWEEEEEEKEKEEEEEMEGEEEILVVDDFTEEEEEEDDPTAASTPPPQTHPLSLTTNDRVNPPASGSSTAPPSSSRRAPPGAPKKRRPKCAKCKNHGVVVEIMRHKRKCPYKKCLCLKCKQTDDRQVVMKLQQRVRRTPQTPASVVAQILPQASDGQEVSQVLKFPHPFKSEVYLKNLKASLEMVSASMGSPLEGIATQALAYCLLKFSRSTQAAVRKIEDSRRELRSYSVAPLLPLSSASSALFALPLFPHHLLPPPYPLSLAGPPPPSSAFASTTDLSSLSLRFPRFF